ncbi:hypothetical protein DPMN_066924 [Dreissena polymorpha]|uniref:Uncharacterized protein n=1 Tax=Dreissena polymorpha TaxID=45954 RepID=A0A9D3YYB4_DREPO|nr:hypothetical protein DPMN_066924 [Dreissena polymorpha]
MTSATSVSVRVTPSSSVTYGTSTSATSKAATSEIGAGDQIGASVMEMLKNIHRRVDQFES